MVQDASLRRIGSSPLVSSALDRDAIVGKPIAPTVFEICDLIYLGDPRIAELRDRCLMYHRPARNFRGPESHLRPAGQAILPYCRPTAPNRNSVKESRPIRPIFSERVSELAHTLIQDVGLSCPAFSSAPSSLPGGDLARSFPVSRERTTVIWNSECRATACGGHFLMLLCYLAR